VIGEVVRVVLLFYLMPLWTVLLARLDNVMLLRETVRPEEGRALAMFVGGALVAGAVATALALTGSVDWPPAPDGRWTWLALALALLFLVGNLSLQYGAARLPANRTAVVMLTEVLFASVSAVILGGEVLTMPLLIGGGLIALAAALSAVTPSVRPSAPAPLQEPVR